MMIKKEYCLPVIIGIFFTALFLYRFVVHDRGMVVETRKKVHHVKSSPISGPMVAGHVQSRSMYHNNRWSDQDNGISEGYDVHGQSDETADLRSYSIEELSSICQNHEFADEMRSRALGLLLARLAQEKDRNYAFETLCGIKDDFKGEDAQFIFKALKQYADLGANDEIVDSFLGQDAGLSEMDRVRMLSYLDPAFPLAETSISALTRCYDRTEEQDVRDAILSAMAGAGGNAGLSWLADLLSEESDPEERSRIYQVLGRSDSDAALVFLNNLLDYMAKESQGDVGEISEIREVILRLKGVGSPHASR